MGVEWHATRILLDEPGPTRESLSRKPSSLSYLLRCAVMDKPDPRAQRCNVCTRHGSSVVLSACSRCRVTFYCSSEHQTADFDSHRPLCVAVKAARDRVTAKESLLQDESEMDLERYDNADYLRARGHYALALASVNTRASLATALDVALDRLRLSPQGKGVEIEGLPIILALQGKLQESYDFISSCSTGSSWVSRNVVLDTHGADMIESLSRLGERRECLLPVLTFIKLEVATQIQDAIQARTMAVKKRLPEAVGAFVAEFLSPPLPGRSVKQLLTISKQVEAQAIDSFRLTHAQVWKDVAEGVRTPRSWNRFVNSKDLWTIPLSKLWRRHTAFITKHNPPTLRYEW